MNYKVFFSHYRSAVAQLLRLVYPILAAHQIEALVSLLNSIIAGRHNPLWVAGTGLGNTTFIAVMGFGWGIMTAVGIITAKQLGQTSDINQTGKTLKASLLTMIIISVPIMILLKYMYPIWLFFGQSPEVAQLGQEYLNGVLWIVFADLAKFTVFQFAIAHQRVVAPLIATVVSIPLIILVNSILILYWGVYGLGLGTAIVYWVTFLALWLYYYQDRLFSACLSVSLSFKEYIELSFQQFSLGIPMGVMSTVQSLFFVVIGLWAGQISTNHLVAHVIAMNWLNFTIMGAVSFSEAITILMAKSYLRNHVTNMMKVLYAGVGLSGFSMTMLSCIYWITPGVLIRLGLGSHINHPHLIYITKVTFALCGIFQIFDGIRIALSGALRGLSDTQYPMWITLFAFWGIGLPIAYLFTFTLCWKQIGLWFGMTSAVITMIGLQYYRIRKLLALQDELNLSISS